MSKKDTIPDELKTSDFIYVGLWNWSKKDNSIMFHDCGDIVPNNKTVGYSSVELSSRLKGTFSHRRCRGCKKKVPNEVIKTYEFYKKLNGL